MLTSIIINAKPKWEDTLSLPDAYHIPITKETLEELYGKDAFNRKKINYSSAF